MLEYITNQFPRDCALVSAVNARTFLRKQINWDCLPEEMFFEEYKALATLACCHKGDTAIHVERLYPYLGIDYHKHDYNKSWIIKNLPVEICLEIGYQHFVLITRANKDEVELINFDPSNKIKTLSWIELEKFRNSNKLKSFFLLIK